MPMLCIAGTFQITGTQPDGDSVRFYPNEPGAWSAVPGGNRVRVNARGGAQLRLDAVDALETHYAPRGGRVLHQPLPLAHAASEGLLEFLGFTEVLRREETVTASTPESLRGWILTRSADDYGRCIALAGSGEAPEPSGTQAYVDVDLLRETANHHLVATGLAYPTFYSKLFFDLRDEFAAVAQSAREAAHGVFEDDRTNTGVTVESLETLTDDAVILPKLFRRLVDYLHLSDPSPDLSGFLAFLSQREDLLYVRSTGQRTALHAVTEVDGQTVALTTVPENLIFDEK